MNITGNLATEERLGWIRARLAADGSVRINEAAVELRVSEMTIRRDLQELEAMGQARRVRGGAVAVGPTPFADRHRHRARAKSRIAAKLLPLVPPTGAIAVDASSTLLRLSSALESARDLVIVTNGLQTFEALQGTPGIRPVLTGGEHDPRTGSLVGPLACRSASTFLLQRLFISAAGVDPEHGTSEAAIEEAEVKRALAAVAAEVVLAVDASKLGTRGLATAIPWDQVTTLVTDLDPGDDRLTTYRGLTTVV